MHVKFAELPVFDQDRAIAFYTEKLFWSVAVDGAYGQGGWRWIELALPGAQTHVLFSRRADDTPSDKPVLVLIAEDLQETVDKLRAGQVEIIAEPQQAPWDKNTTFAEFRDSEGNRMVISQK